MDATPDDEPLVSCDLQGGTLSVYPDRIDIERTSASIHEDKTIPLAEVSGVSYSEGLTTGYFQIEQVGVEIDDAGLFSKPVDENTLYFPRSARDCTRRARDAILERASG